MGFDEGAGFGLPLQGVHALVATRRGEEGGGRVTVEGGSAIVNEEEIDQKEAEEDIGDGVGGSWDRIVGEAEERTKINATIHGIVLCIVERLCVQSIIEGMDGVVEGCE